MRDEHSIMTVSSLAQGHYGLNHVCIGLPTVVGRNGAEDIIEIPLNAQEREALSESAQGLQKIMESL